jgi:hypothetical protein
MNKEIEKKQNKKILAQDSDYKVTFSSVAGEKVLHDLVSQFWLLDSTIATDTNHICFREGQRSVVLHLLNVLEQSTSSLRKMLNKRLKESYEDSNYIGGLDV